MNRIATYLKAALNQAVADGLTRNVVWREAKPFKGADEPQVRWLEDIEAMRFGAASLRDFRQIAVAALLTGRDWGELRQDHIGNLDLDHHALNVRRGKRGWHTVVLTDEAVEHFRTVIGNRPPEDPIFLRADGDPWGKSHQSGRMRSACAAAKITPTIKFHILRHTWNGVAIQYVSRQLGHKSIVMTMKHYAHVIPADLAAAVRGVPALGIAA